MTHTADVLVVGGGLMGCVAAYSLSRQGVRVVLAERNARPGMETTARSGAIIRAHYGVPELVTLALEANRRYARFEEEVGLPCGFVKCGYAVMVNEGDVDTLRANVSMHRERGVTVELVSPGALKAMAPPLKTHDIALAAWEPEGGYADPARTVAAYAARAQDLGADLRFGAAVTAARPTMDGWNVRLGDGSEISAGQTILCTGNWSRPVGALFGLDLPVTPVRAQIAVLDRPGDPHAAFPVLSDLINLAYFRAEGDGGMWVGSSDMADLHETLPSPDGFAETADPPAVAGACRKAALRFDGLDGGDKGCVQRAFAGLYETTPDWQPIIDSFGGGRHAAVGFSGHGFKLAPVVGEILAGRALGRPSPLDTPLFGLARFAEGRPIQSQHTYQRARFLR